MNRKFGLLVGFGLAALMAACAPGAGQQPTEEQPTDEPTAEVTDQPTEAPDEETAEPESDEGAQQQALEALAAELGIDVSELQLVLAEPVEWTDSCLGLGGPAESCLAAIVPGWRVIVSANGTEYEVRTDETGETVRINLNATDESNPAVVAAQSALAEHLEIEMADVTLISVEHVEWSDGCLGLAGPDEMCTMAIVPGWRVMLSVDETEYEVRTDETGSYVKINLGGQSDAITK
jgi:hypothetical protein